MTTRLSTVCPKTVITNTSFPWKPTHQWKLKEKAGQIIQHLPHGKFFLPLVRWAVSTMSSQSCFVAMAPLTFHRKEAAKWPDSKVLLPFSLPVPCSSTGPTILSCYIELCALKQVSSSKRFTSWMLQNKCTCFGIYHEKGLSASRVLIKLRYKRQPYQIIEKYSSITKYTFSHLFCWPPTIWKTGLLYRWVSYIPCFYQLLSHQMLVMIC